jgi:tyrosine-protein kinase Etk/Wzc
MIPLEEENESINIQEVLAKYLIHWKWITLFILLTVGAAYAYLRYATSIYESEATVLIKDDKKGGLANELAVFKDLGLGSVSSNLNNEIELFRSRKLIASVVKDLSLQKQIISVGQKSGLTKTELYDRSPITLNYVKGDSILYDSSYVYSVQIIDNSSFELLTGEEEKIGVYQFDEEINLKQGAFIALKTPFFDDKWHDRTLIISYNTLDKTVNAYRNQLLVEAISKDASICR